MGRTYAPSLADLKQGFDEVLLEERVREALSQAQADFFLKHYRRYLDDIYFHWLLQWSDTLPLIYELMNSIDNNIHYDYQTSIEDPKNSSPYLDVRTIIKDCMVKTDIYAKKTDTFNYLPFNSCHPRHTIRNIVFVLARRIRGIVSDPILLPLRMTEMEERLTKKRYPKGLIKEGIRKAMLIDRKDILAEKIKVDNEVPKSSQPTYFVSTYNPLIEDPMKQIRPATEIYNASVTSPTDKVTIKSSYRKSPSLKDLLMFRSSGTGNSVNKCMKGCKLYENYLHLGDRLHLKDERILIPNEIFDCLSRDLLYIAVCEGCGEFYLGETGDQISSRFTVHRQQSQITSDLQPVKADQHFRTCGKNKYKVFPFKRLKRKNCTIYRRIVEDHFIQTLKPKLNGQYCKNKPSWLHSKPWKVQTMFP